MSHPRVTWMICYLTKSLHKECSIVFAKWLLNVVAYKEFSLMTPVVMCALWQMKLEQREILVSWLLPVSVLVYLYNPMLFTYIIVHLLWSVAIIFDFVTSIKSWILKHVLIDLIKEFLQFINVENCYLSCTVIWMWSIVSDNAMYRLTFQCHIIVYIYCCCCCFVFLFSLSTFPDFI